MDQKRVGAFIASLRKEKGMTQEALGERLGVTNKTVSRWENGNYMPDIGLLLPLAETLGTSVNELLSGERLTEAAYRERAEKNLVEVLQKSAFSVREKTIYFTRKWNREHRFEMILWAILYLAAGVLAWLFDKSWIAPVLGPAAVAIVIGLKNKRACYVEGKLYGSAPELAQKKEK
jgi:predicted transcriptional regulators